MGSLLFLALVQSLTEFLPISSSGHLLLSNFFGLSRQGVGVDVMLHLGTLLAVMIYFRRDVWQMVCFKNMHLLMNLVVGTLPIVAAGSLLLLFDLPLLRGAFWVGVCSLFFGWLLWWVDEKYPCLRKLEQMTFSQAFLIGVAQVLALIPGTSRSGITITCARGLGFNRKESARFSMLLSIPAIFLAGCYAVFKAGQGAFILPPLSELSVALLAAAMFGLLVIACLMKWLQKASFLIFAVYRILVGVLVLLSLWF